MTNTKTDFVVLVILNNNAYKLSAVEETRQTYKDTVYAIYIYILLTERKILPYFKNCCILP